ncbi:MAG: bifunctional phosphopantothenoylcysteine decarboxylase/phosphopantothenate--cysteine ligase CoaBC [Saprospiraceae bacterium]|nr:bifunctional phosphopantothenoylcysteine decarboxylase/phosphopantothenate--cysteine ligase CoaBC [Saprospiraceae bacterium]
MFSMKIILGISGSIAAYKAAYLTRLLVKNGAEVKVIMTRAAADFISPLTLSTLSKNEVITDIHSESAWNNHVELGLWADAMIVAPATANTLAKLANGLCDNILSAVYLSARCPVFVAPAMDVDMWHHPATQQNMSRLTSFGIQVIPVEHGELASGLVGEGRMAEPEHIVAFLDKSLTSGRTQPLQGKSALVTAGPTFEALDPVRFLGNHSSGKMGIAIAETLRRQGAEVTLVLGPTDLSPTDASIQVIRVNSAAEMYDACKDRFPQTDITVLAAAVADYRPKEVSETKIKKQSDDLSLELVRTVDIAASLGKVKTDKQLLIGFALETNNEEENALAKLKKKNFDFIVLNSMRDKGAGFGHDTNKIVILKSSGEKIDYALKSKSEVARDIVAEIIVAANQ